MHSAQPSGPGTTAPALVKGGNAVATGLEQAARELAAGHSVSHMTGRAPSLLDELADLELVLNGAYRYFSEAAGAEVAFSYAAEWLLDNFYVIQQAIRQVREDMPISYYRELPKIREGDQAGLPRVYAIARGVVDEGSGQMDMDRLESFVRAYQEVAPLTMGELWAVPTMLRLRTMEDLTEAISRITDIPRGETWRGNGTEPKTAATPQDETTVATAILVLRLLAAQDWKVFFESVSLVDEALLRDPAEIYGRMDFATRDRYRGVVEVLAGSTGQAEPEVAKQAVVLARQVCENGGGQMDAEIEVPAAAHVGFYLLGQGRQELEHQVGYRPDWRERMGRLAMRHPLRLYIATTSALTLLMLAGIAVYAVGASTSWRDWVAASLLAMMPCVTIAVEIANWLVTTRVPPRVLPKMDFGEGIPDAFRSMVVIPAILGSSRDVDAVVRWLETHYIANSDPNLGFALLTDLADAPSKRMREDRELLRKLSEAISGLNNKYGIVDGGPFFVFHRERQWNAAEGCWMGWERKRGKLVEFNRLLRGARDTSFTIRIGNLDFLPQTKFVITLDVDTLVPRDGAIRLVATLAHPLNRPRFDPQTGRLTQGYSILQPRVEINPGSANISRYTRVFSGDTGLDLYTKAASDLYQDLYGEGIYVGKGIYDVDAFERSLADKVPDNTLLSHDLFEGVQGRAGLVEDEVVFEGFPPEYLVGTHRMHRWVRGDWQLLPWLLPRVPNANGAMVPNALSVLDRWKILENLRRSLQGPAAFLLLVAGWVFLPGSPWVWMLLGGLSFGLPVLRSALANVVRRVRSGGFVVGGGGLGLGVARWLLAVVFLPYEALIVSDAIVTTLVRMLITRKRLLQWITPAHTIRIFGRERKLALAWRRMQGAPAAALAAASLIALFKPAAFPVAAPLIAVWLVSPQIAVWISRPIAEEPVTLSPEDTRKLRRLARRTWHYFERFVGPDDHWLPPDHYQEDPRGLVAHRTSPTNIGLLLLSDVGAHDLGHIGTMELAFRLTDTFDSIDELEHFRGHLLNWYSTSTLDPLPPRYVSAVDSGNLAAALLVLKRQCLAMSGERAFGWRFWQGFLDTLDVLDEVLVRLGATELEMKTTALRRHLAAVRERVLAAERTPARWHELLADISDAGWQELERLLLAFVEANVETLESSALTSLRVWMERVRVDLDRRLREMEMLVPWLALLDQKLALFGSADLPHDVSLAWQALRQALKADPELADVVPICRAGLGALETLKALLGDAKRWKGIAPEQITDARLWCSQLRSQLMATQRNAATALVSYQQLANRCEQAFQAMDFGFLFDGHRSIFHIGYNVESGRLDANHYDLLASEARIASIVAIAKGDVPQSHWLHLSRPLTRLDGTQALLSWSGTMFEYVMPTLLLTSYRNTLLDQSVHAAVRRQIAYGHQKGVPWGISESGYYAFDGAMNYQYRAFGVPGLGLKRGLEKDLVIAPYASLVALQLRPRAVMDNIAHLERIGMLGNYGFYEAIDYTPARVPAGRRGAMVKSYMAHHQGMTLVSLVNWLGDDAMIRRFSSDLRVRSTEWLLSEQVPVRAPIETLKPEEIPAVRRRPEIAVTAAWQAPALGPVPNVHVLSNGTYTVLLTSAGAGYSRWGEFDLTRWRADVTRENTGTWVYVRDQQSGTLWSVGCQPTACGAERENAVFSAHMAEFLRSDFEVSLDMQVTVPPYDDAEIRLVSLTNQAGRPRELTVATYGEVVLAPQASDRRHPAFNKLFIESEYVPELNGLLFRRRPRSSDEKPVVMMHLLVPEPGMETSGSYEADRARFLGRGGTQRAPAALTARDQGPAPPHLSGSVGATLDPVMALAQSVKLRPHGTARVAVVTLAASTRRQALELARRYQSWEVITTAADLARTQAELELRRLGMDSPALETAERALSALLYPQPALRADAATLARNRKGQSGLWAYAISGDYPILLLRIEDQVDIGLLQDLLRAQTYWRQRCITADLVILNERESGYEQELQGQLHRAIVRAGADSWLNQRGGVFLLRADQMSEADRTLLASVARAMFVGGAGTLAEQIAAARTERTVLPAFVPVVPAGREEEPTPPLERPTDLLHDNGFGGFSRDGQEYVIYLEPGEHLPNPWVNVVANHNFGFVISEAGAGYTWAENSGENRLTTWRNDPVTDAPSEALYLRDEDTGHVWSPTPGPAPEQAPYLIRHGAGYSVFEHACHGIRQRVHVFAARDDPVKVIHLRLENTWGRVRRVTATFYAEWVLGNDRDSMQQFIDCEFDAVANVLLARNTYNADFGRRVAFVASNKEPAGLTSDRTEFLGRAGGFDQPAALGRVGLTGRVRAGLDPCAAMQVHVWLAPGEAEEVVFLLGQGADRNEAVRLAQRYQDLEEVEQAWQVATARWDDVLDVVRVSTPDPGMDLLLNRWLLYQSLSCRVWGRSALYQSSGAYGYRDQLQDVMAYVYARPDLAREQILQAAAHQFEAGDVLHWWHPPADRGVRTRYTDDLLWLPFVTAHYVEATGDVSVLEERAPYLQAEPLGEGEVERYGQFQLAEEQGTVFEHCARAIEQGLTAGPHGIPLMGGGDWNDGMNRIGIGGQGESVWLGWFLYAVLTKFAALCDATGRAELAESYRDKGEVLRQALEESAWDGAWYRRAYYDDGTPLGSKDSDECQIDAIAQSWAVLSGGADEARARQAMESVGQHLVRSGDRLLLLLTPPFDKTKHDPGYIKGYLPGIRENGGQYTHAAIWTVWAYAALGQGDKAEELFRLLNPIYHSNTPEEASRYRVEPYVVAADVYSVPPHVGRGGWTWYTGSASWMYRLGLEGILGLRKRGDALRFDPCIPSAWPGFEMAYTHGSARYQVAVENPEGVNRGVKRVELDGEVVPTGEVPLRDDGAVHHVHVLMGRA